LYVNIRGRAGVGVCIDIGAGVRVFDRVRFHDPHLHSVPRISPPCLETQPLQAYAVMPVCVSVRVCVCVCVCVFVCLCICMRLWPSVYV
jgi:hypothetical protein